MNIGLYLTAHFLLIKFYADRLLDFVDLNVQFNSSSGPLDRIISTVFSG